MLYPNVRDPRVSARLPGPKLRTASGLKDFEASGGQARPGAISLMAPQEYTKYIYIGC